MVKTKGFKLGKIIFSISTALLLATPLFSKADMKLVNEYIEVSGTKEILIALPKRIEQGYLNNIQDATLKNINIKKNFHYEPTINYVKMKLSDELSNSILKQTIDFYKTPIGKKFKNNGLNSISKSDIEKKEQFYANLGQYPPSYKRLNTLNTFIDRLELSPIAVHIIGELLGKINANIVTAINPDQIMKNRSDQIKTFLYQHSLYAYGDLTEKELKSIIHYFNTNAGRFEQMVISNIFKQLIKDSFTQIILDSQQQIASH